VCPPVAGTVNQLHVVHMNNVKDQILHICVNVTEANSPGASAQSRLPQCPLGFALHDHQSTNLFRDANGATTLEDSLHPVSSGTVDCVGAAAAISLYCLPWKHYCS
jgi:hypothetical protein